MRYKLPQMRKESYKIMSLGTSRVMNKNIVNVVKSNAMSNKIAKESIKRENFADD